MQFQRSNGFQTLILAKGKPCQIIGQIEASQFKKEQNYLNFNNYLTFRSNDQNSIFKLPLYLAKVFTFDLEVLKQTQEADQFYEKILKFSTLNNEDIELLFNTAKEKYHLFANNRKLKNRTVFLLVNRVSSKIQDPIQNYCGNYTEESLRFIFLSVGGQIIHIYTGCKLNRVDELNRFISKHFTLLQTLIIIDQQSVIKQQRMSLVKQIIIQNKQQAINYIYTSRASYEQIQSVVNENISRFSNEFTFGGLQSIKQLLQNNESPDGHLQKEAISRLQIKISRFIRVHHFILSKYVRESIEFSKKYTQSPMFNSIYAYAFNFLYGDQQQQKHSNQIKGDDIALIQALNTKITKEIVTIIMDHQESDNTQNAQLCNFFSCNKFQQLRKCYVCKKRKVKFGCRRCTRRLGKDIHLCITPCSKLFHLNYNYYASIILKKSEADSKCQHRGFTVEDNQLSKKKQIAKNDQRRGNQWKLSKTNMIQNSRKLHEVKSVQEQAQKLGIKLKIMPSLSNGLRVYGLTIIQHQTIKPKIQNTDESQQKGVKIQHMQEQMGNNGCEMVSIFGQIWQKFPISNTNENTTNEF